jgi:hypothetical protein
MKIILALILATIFVLPMQAQGWPCSDNTCGSNHVCQLCYRQHGICNCP